MREFDLGVLLTGTDGHLLCEFADYHEMVEYLFGHSVWTHELALRADEIKAELLKQHPDLESVKFERPDGVYDMEAYIKDWLKSLEPALGRQRALLPLNQERTSDPVSTLIEAMESASTEG